MMIGTSGWSRSIYHKIQMIINVICLPVLAVVFYPNMVNPVLYR